MTVAEAEQRVRDVEALIARYEPTHWLYSRWREDCGTIRAKVAKELEEAKSQGALNAEQSTTIPD